MRTSMFVINTEGKIFEFDNTQKCTLNIANRFNYHFGKDTGIDDFDVIYFTERETMISVHKSKTEEETHFIIKAIFQKLKEKSDLLYQIQVLKKIKDLDESLINSIKKDIRDNYFEIRIEDILKEFNRN